MKVVNVLRNIAAIIVGYIVLAVSTPIISLIVSFMASIPIIGTFIFYPVETSWAALVIVNTTTVGLGAAAAHFIQPEENAWGMKVYGFLVLIVCVFVLILALKTGQTIWPAILAGGTGLIVGLES